MLAVLARGAAAVGVASVLVFAVPITSANALTAPSPAAVRMVIGSVRAAAPGLAKVAVTLPGRANPIGAVASVGQLLYMTRDAWMPWVQNELGVGGVQSADGGADGVPVQLSLTVDPSPGGVFAVTGTGMSLANFFSGGADYQCKLNGTMGPMQSVQFPWDNFQSGQQRTWSSQCGGGGALTFLQTRHWGYPQWHAANQVSYGEPFDAQTQATYRVDMDCRLADGSMVTISKTTVSPQGGGLLVGSCEAAYPGSHGIGVSLHAGPTGQPLVEQWRQDWNETSALYPNCVGVGVACSYVMEYKGVACVVGQAECINWALKEQVNPQDYQCKYGSYALSISGCGLVERSYEPNGTIVSDANTDGDPSTASDPVPDWLPAPKPTAAPYLPPAGAPGGDPAPVPATPVNPDPTPTPNPNGGSDCWPSGGAAWNPAEWVLQPIKCGLAWAFVPDTATLTALKDGLKADIDRTGLPVVAAAVAVPLTSIPGGSGCAGPEVVFQAGGHSFPVRPFSACDEPLRTAALVTHGLFTVVIVVGGGLGLLRLIGAGFGYNVSLRGGGGS